MNEKAEKQAKEKLDKWLKEMGANDEEENKCNEGFCELIKEEHQHD